MMVAGNVSRRGRGRGGSSALRLSVWILFGGIVLNPLASWGDASRPPEDARDILKSGTVELGIAAGSWQTVDIGNHPLPTIVAPSQELPRYLDCLTGFCG